MTTDKEYYLMLFTWLCDYCVEHHGRFPTHRQIIDAGWFHSTSAVSYALETLLKLELLGKEVIEIQEQRPTYYYINNIVVSFPWRENG